MQRKRSHCGVLRRKRDEGNAFAEACLWIADNSNIFNSLHPGVFEMRSKRLFGDVKWQVADKHRAFVCTIFRIGRTSRTIDSNMVSVDKHVVFGNRGLHHALVHRLEYDVSVARVPLLVKGAVDKGGLLWET